MGIHKKLDEYNFIRKYYDINNNTQTDEGAKTLGIAVHNEIKQFIKAPLPNTTYHYQTVYFLRSIKENGWILIDADDRALLGSRAESLGEGRDVPAAAERAVDQHPGRGVEHEAHDRLGHHRYVIQGHGCLLVEDESACTPA